MLKRPPPDVALRAAGITLRGMSKPGVSGVLSFFVPGVGQIYNGEYWRGLFWLIITPGMWLGTGGLLGWVCHLVASYTAYHRAKPA